MPKLVWIVALFLAGSLHAAEEADLRLRIAKDEALHYDWGISSNYETKGKDGDKDVDLKTEKYLGTVATLKGLESARPGETPIDLTCEGLYIQEERKDADVHSKLKIEGNHILYTENDRTIVDSKNDVGLDKVNEYQKTLRALEKGVAHLTLGPSGKPVQGGNAKLLETIQGGRLNGIFPLLSGQVTALGTPWDERYEMTTLGDLELEKPAGVRTRMTFAKWEERGGVKLALIEFVAAWDSDKLAGQDKERGLKVQIEQLKGLGSGVCYFDPKTGRFTEGSLSFILKYKIEGLRREDQSKVSLDVDGKTAVSFKLKP